MNLTRCEINPRIKQFVSGFDKYNIDAYLITHDVNVTYLTLSTAVDAWLLVSAQKVFYITDARYAHEARKRLNGINIQEYSRSVTEVLFRLVRGMGIKRIGFDERHVSLECYGRILKDCQSGVKLIAKNNAVERLREIKEKDEIAKIRAAVKLNLAAYKYLKRVIKPGRTERDVLLRLERYVKSRGAAFSFDPIIASGQNSCFPHARVTDRNIRNHESVMVDIGIDIMGYKSDLTRVFFLGRIPRLIREVYDAVNFAQHQAIKKVKPGVTASEIDQAARGYLKKHGLAKFFNHSLGHGVGLEVHEMPVISQKNQEVLKEGMIFTVEPAVYIPDKFGIRIEDIVMVTHDGCEVLSRS